MRTAVAAFSTFLLLSTAVAMAAPGDSGAIVGPAIGTAFDTAMSRGDVLLAAGDDRGAEREFRTALTHVPAGTPRREARADALHKLGIALAHQTKYPDAEPVILEAEALARAARGNISVLLADVLRAKTVVLYRTGRIDQARAAFREAKAILEASADAWVTESDASAWRHKASGWRFPEAAGPFTRLRRTILDGIGDNVVVHYRIGPQAPGQDSWGATLVSVYLTVERGVPLAGEFAASKREILRQFPHATTISDGAKTIAGMPGFEATFDVPPATNGRVRRTSFSAFETGKVMIRVRASYPETETATRAEQVADLVANLVAGSTSP